MLTYHDLLKFTERFYNKAIQDILIGFHFKKIPHFSENFPRLADFWFARLGNELHNPKHLPFSLIEIHRPLNLTAGQINRWSLLFKQTIGELQLEISSPQWKTLEVEMEKVKQIILRNL